MAADIWGPMVWDTLHFAAEEYDVAESTPLSESKVRVFALYLFLLGYVLPCRACRESYMGFVKELYDTGAMTRALREGKTQELMCALHDRVNLKLNKPLFVVDPRTNALDPKRVDVVRRRAVVWSFNDDNFLGLLFIVALNYNNNGVSDALKEEFYRRFFAIIPLFLRSIGRISLASQLQTACDAIRGLPALSEAALVDNLLDVYETLNPNGPSCADIIDRYALCRAGAGAPECAARRRRLSGHR